MAEELEIERKFLVALPAAGSLSGVRRRLHILQTYLVNGTGGSQRRVRRIEENGEVSYTFTEKVFISDMVRRENEREITAAEYEELLTQARTDFKPIDKIRTGFGYKGQYFELDVYPFSDRLAIMEFEMKSTDQPIDFPEDIHIIKEVTGIRAYMNSALANAGKFPDDAETEC